MVVGNLSDEFLVHVSTSRYRSLLKRLEKASECARLEEHESIYFWDVLQKNLSSLVRVVRIEHDGLTRKHLNYRIEPSVAFRTIVSLLETGRKIEAIAILKRHNSIRLSVQEAIN